MKLTKVNFHDLSKEITLRNDYQFLDYYNSTENNVYYNFYELFEIIDAKKNVILPNDDFYYAEIGMTNSDNEVNAIQLNFNYRDEDEDNETFYKKISRGNIIKPQLGDILISKVRPNLKKIIFIDGEKKDVYFTSAFICIRPKKLKKILYYALRSVFFQDILSLSRIGKGYPTLNEKDIMGLKFSKSLIDTLESQEKHLNKEIINKEKDILSMRKKRTNESEIINKIFDDKYQFNEILEKNYSSSYTIGFSKLSEDMDLRFSPKFHRLTKTKIENKFNELKSRRIKEFVKTPIMTGKSISPMDYSQEDLGISYISMKSIGSWYLDKENMDFVTVSYENNNSYKKPSGHKDLCSTKVEKNDILMIRSGEGAIGKVALVDEEVNAIFSDFVIRIQLENYNPKFAYYLFRTKIYQKLIEIYKKGLGNNTNIFPNVIKDFPLISENISEQNRIVNEISSKIQENKQCIHQMRVLLDSIEDLIKKNID
ncbi:restriction endonuclease subunit S domain-containing protein [Macrococcoides caseolyticum]|nr:hypothetical protein [Macrococcus caseolyticus]RKO14100.1 hypothetical protein D6861_08335 [Macrococcus caseolyticus]